VRFSCQARFRHRQALQDACALITGEGALELTFETPQRAITPGQAAVLYIGEECIGGGTIDEVFQ
jgi:tRNA-specific 2-thiouridylase